MWQAASLKPLNYIYIYIYILKRINSCETNLGTDNFDTTYLLYSFDELKIILIVLEMQRLSYMND